MITNLYAIRDRAAEETGPLFHAKNDAVAVRQFQQLTKDSPYVADMKLLFFGTFNHDTSDLDVLTQPYVVEVTLNTEVIDEQA